MSQAIIVAGQSNALGFNVTAAELPCGYRPDPNVVIWNMAESRWDMMIAGVNTGTPANPGAWGPEVGYAMAWTATHPNEILYVVKQVKGETALAQTAGLDWSPESDGELFDLTTALSRDAILARWKTRLARFFRLGRLKFANASKGALPFVVKRAVARR